MKTSIILGIRPEIIKNISWNFGSKVKVSDTQSGFRAYSQKIFETLPLSERGMGVSIETLEKARRKGAIIKEVPISCRYVPTTLNLLNFPNLNITLRSVLALTLKRPAKCSSALRRCFWKRSPM